MPSSPEHPESTQDFMQPDPQLAETLGKLLPRIPREIPEQLTHVHTMPAREAVYSPWSEWIHPRVIECFHMMGVDEPFEHQMQAADSVHAALVHAHRGNAQSLKHTIISTGTASGKSLSYLAPAFDTIYRAENHQPHEGTADERATVLYISPARALSADQLNSIRAYSLPGLYAASYDGDTPVDERRVIREQANFVLATPEMLNFSILGQHRSWSRFLRSLRLVILDEVHSYRGVFGAQIANLLRRLRRVAALYKSTPVFFGASATSANPAQAFGSLIGVPEDRICTITRSTAPSGERTVLLWEPEFLPEEATDKLAARGFDTRSEAEKNAPQRISAGEQASRMLTDLVLSRTRTLAFSTSRRGAELLSQKTQSYLAEADPSLVHRVAAYRSGYTPEERRDIERRLRNGELLGLASTSALELGIDISGLDAVLLAGWPGTRAAFMQRIGRAGRGGQESIAVLIAREDPLDTFLVHHPEAIFGRPVEATIFDPTNPYVLSPQLCAAAEETPLRAEELHLFGPHTRALLDRLVAQGYLRARPDGWYWTHAESAAQLVDLRGTGGAPFQLIDQDGTLVGTMDREQALTQGHPGAIYLHQGKQYLVESWDEQSKVILLSRAHPDYYTKALESTQVRVLQEKARVSFSAFGIPEAVILHRGRVQVTDRVLGYQRLAISGGNYLSEELLEMPPSILHTEACWLSFDPAFLRAAGVQEPAAPGTLHAAEHAMIGLLPLLATCDRWDLGGLSTLYHEDTDAPSIYIYDAAAGGAGFSERGFNAMTAWISSTLRAIQSCTCESGCPSCVQSPKCGNRNDPLDKAGALSLLQAILQALNTPQLPNQGFEDLPASPPGL
ncbi:DEAD/DEAH box helicase [Rothia sp. (in: high G+C Gram-positive bacteria)]|uniref:DEAD/DEAH box helicase n=1 Tax=Rothia sp. (in: high G+C Gram-positive bacteria) TaxID=1885016 RepID=UPI0034CD1D86